MKCIKTSENDSFRPIQNERLDGAYINSDKYSYYLYRYIWSEREKERERAVAPKASVKMGVNTPEELDLCVISMKSIKNRVCFIFNTITVIE